VPVLIVLLVVLALVVAGLLAVGRGDPLDRAVPDRAYVPFPVDEPVTPDDVVGVRLDVGWRGYRMAEVDEVLDRLAWELATRDDRIRTLEGYRTSDGSPAVDAGEEPQSTAGEPVAVDAAAEHQGPARDGAGGAAPSLP